jgi:hypothetical protein
VKRQEFVFFGLPLTPSLAIQREGIRVISRTPPCGVVEKEKLSLFEIDNGEGNV